MADTRDDHLGPYRILRLVGRSDVGSEFEAVHRDTGTRVLLRTLSPWFAREPRVLRGFLHSAECAARLRHPHVAPLLDRGVEDDAHWYALPFPTGGRLSERIASRGPHSPAEAGPILRPLADALEFAHSHGAMHGNVSPENVLLDAAGCVALAGFLPFPSEGEPAGTPGYAPPERADDADPDPRGDVYGLAALAWAMRTGRSPLEGRALPLRDLVPGATEAEEAVLARALSREPTDRPATPAEFLREWEQAARADLTA